MKIPFSPPFIDDDVKREVLDTLESGWITSGPKVLELEQHLCKLTGLGNVACCNSATSGLLLALRWYGVGPGDEVIIPSYTYAATALAVMHVGATPVMVDVGDDFNIRPDTLASKISENTKVIIPVDIAGWPCDYESIRKVIKEPHVKRKFKPSNDEQRKMGRIMLLSDSAHSIGATYKNKPSVRCSDLSVFSFHAVKNVTTAEGGAIIVNLPAQFDSEMVYRQLKLWSLNGQTKDAYTKTNGSDWKYDIVYPGFKMNMPDVCAAIGLAQLRKYEDVLLPERRRVFQSYLNHFSSFEWAELPPYRDKDRVSSCHIFALRIKGINESQRDKMIERMVDLGVSANVHFQPLPMLTVFKQRGYSISDFPMSYENYSREISLPVYAGLDEEKVKYVVTSVTEAYETVMSHI